MRNPSRTSHLVILSVLIAAAVWSLPACGGSPAPQPPQALSSVTGTITLPAGVAVDLATLTATTPSGSARVSAAGTFEVQVFAGAATEVGIETAGGDLLLLGVTDGSKVDVSLTSTAEALLYYLTGAVWLPPAQQDTVRELLRGRPEAGILADELDQQLRAGGNGLRDPDGALLAALDAAHASLLGDARLAGLAARAAEAALRVSGAERLTPAAVEDNNILIDPGSPQSGAEVVHNPNGAGVVAQNSYRRPAALLAYEVGWEDADRVLHDVDPPGLVERVDVPATGKLELFTNLLDAITGDAPWAPALSDPLRLAGRLGASRTHYQLVLIGPGTNGSASPIASDPRFASFRGEWDDIAFEKSLELFLNDLLLPVMEVYGLGSMAKLDAAKLAKMRGEVRAIYDTHLTGLGVFLKPGEGSYANGLRFVIEELASNKMFRLDMMEMVGNALAESDRNKVAMEALESRLKARASATAILAAVEAALVSGDVAKVMLDLRDSRTVESWEAVSSASLFALTPETARVRRDHASARFKVLPKGNTTGNYLYRWSTSGAYGLITDLLQPEALTIDTREREVEYFHSHPLDIDDDQVDTVTVEVFEVEAGATSIPAGATPVARMTATVRGDDRNLDSRIEFVYDLTPLGMYRDDLRFECVEANFRFKAVPGAKSYLLNIRNIGGQGDDRNPNQDTEYRGRNHTLLIDPNAKKDGATVPDGMVGEYWGPCQWQVEGIWALPPLGFSANYDATKDEFVVYLFVWEDTTPINRYGIPVAPQVELFRDWLDGATFDVQVRR